MNTELKGLFASSSDPTEVSTRVQGIVVGASAIVIGLGAHLFGVQLSASDVVQLGSGLGMVAGAIVFILGIVKAVIRKYGTK